MSAASPGAAATHGPASSPAPLPPPLLDFVYVVDAGSLSGAGPVTVGAGAAAADHACGRPPGQPSPSPSLSPRHRARYTAADLQTALSTAGLKPKIARKAAKLTFRRLAAEAVAASGGAAAATTTARVARQDFEALVSGAVTAAARKADGAPDESPTVTTATLPRPDFALACALTERRLPLVVLLAGTSGSGKSTLASLLAGRLGGAAVLSTDAVRGVVRGALQGGGGGGEERRILAASTYEAGAALDGGGGGGAGGGPSSRAVRGWAAQAALVQPALGRAIAAAVAAGEPVVVEGAHITIPWALELMERLGGPDHPTPAVVIPFLAFISNPAKHADRFAVRAKYMAADAGANKYVRSLDAIRSIQDALLEAAGGAGVPAVDNTAVDRSVGAMHAAVLGCLRRAVVGGERLVVRGAGPGAAALSCPAVAAEFAGATAARWSSKLALRSIREKRAGARAVVAGRSPGVTPRPSSAAVIAAGSDGDVDGEAGGGRGGGEQEGGSDGGASSSDDAAGAEEAAAAATAAAATAAAATAAAASASITSLSLDPQTRTARAALAAAAAAGASVSEGGDPSDFHPRAGAGAFFFSSDDGGGEGRGGGGLTTVTEGL